MQFAHRRVEFGVGQPLQRFVFGRPHTARRTRARGREVTIGDDLYGQGCRLPHLLSVAVDEGVGEDPLQPRVEVAALPERGKIRIGLDEGVLHEVFCIRVLVGHPSGLTVEPRQQWDHVAFESGAQLCGGTWLGC